MPAVRTASVSLISLILLCVSGSDPRQSDARIWGDRGAAARHVRASLALSHSGSLPHLSSTAAFAPRRNRLKSVLEETTKIGVDELDLGPAVLPSHDSRAASIRLLDHSPPTAPPLRC